MKNEILLILADKWIQDAATEANEETVDTAVVKDLVHEAKRKGMREAKRECAETIKMLVETLG